MITAVIICNLALASCQQDYSKELIKHYFQTEQVDTALKIAYRESRYLPGTVHINKGSKDRGIFQLNNYFHREVSDNCAYDAECNIKQSVRIQKERGWGEWASYKILK